MNTTFESTVPSTTVAMDQALPPLGTANISMFDVCTATTAGSGEVPPITEAIRTNLTRVGGEVVVAANADQGPLDQRDTTIQIQAPAANSGGEEPGRVTLLERLRATGSVAFALGAMSLLVAPTILGMGKKSAAENAVEVNGTRNRLTGRATFSVTEATRTREGRGKIAKSPTGSPRVSTRQVRAKNAGEAIQKVSRDDGSLKATERVRHWGRTH